MKIALLSPFEERVPPRKYGGTELIVYNLAEGLVKMGHEVHLFASGDSATSAKLHAVTERSLREYEGSQDMKVRDVLKLVHVGKALRMIRDLKPDIVHNHIGWRVLPFADLLGFPMLTTLHGPLDVGYQKAAYGAHKDANYVSISNNQREPLPDLNYVATVYNGIDTERLRYSSRGGDYLAFLGRMSPEKGPLQAIRIARRFGMKLRMAAKVDLVDREYFEKEIKPNIDGDKVEFIGEIGSDEKSDFLGGAYALLAPIQWREPFGLFMTEAMACGTPVVAARMGAAPELVQDGITGFVVQNETESFVEALGKIPSISRAHCRDRVVSLFSSEAMAKGYEEAYRRVTKS